MIQFRCSVKTLNNYYRSAKGVTRKGTKYAAVAGRAFFVSKACSKTGLSPFELQMKAHVMKSFMSVYVTPIIKSVAGNLKKIMCN